MKHSGVRKKRSPFTISEIDDMVYTGDDTINTFIDLGYDDVGPDTFHLGPDSFNVDVSDYSPEEVQNGIISPTDDDEDDPILDSFLDSLAQGGEQNVDVADNSNVTSFIPIGDCKCGRVPQPNVVGELKELNRPWMVHFKMRLESLDYVECSGSLINKRWIISAAHCFCVLGMVKYIIYNN